MCLVHNKFLVSFLYVSACCPSMKSDEWEWGCMEQTEGQLQVSCSVAAVRTLSVSYYE
jgi:hypothetical protein